MILTKRPWNRSSRRGSSMTDSSFAGDGCETIKLILYLYYIGQYECTLPTSVPRVGSQKLRHFLIYELRSLDFNNQAVSHNASPNLREDGSCEAKGLPISDLILAMKKNGAWESGFSPRASGSSKSISFRYKAAKARGIQ